MDGVELFYIAAICVLLLLMCGAAAVAEALEPDPDLRGVWFPEDEL